MRRRTLLGFGAALLVLATTLPLAAAEEHVKIALTDGVSPGRTGKWLRFAARLFKPLLDSGDVRTEAADGGDAADLAAKLKADEVQLGVFLGIEFAWARQHNPGLEPIALCVTGSRTVKAHLLVRAGSPYRTPEDLRGKFLAVPAETRGHCHIFLRAKCAPQSGDPKQFYKKVMTVDDVEAALDAVVDGEAAAAVVDGLAWESYRESKPGAAKRLRVLLDSGPLPCAVIACQAGRFGAAQKRQLRDGLIRAKDTRTGRGLLALVRLTRFEAVPDDFERQLAETARAFPQPGQ